MASGKREWSGEGASGPAAKRPNGDYDRDDEEDFDREVDDETEFTAAEERVDVELDIGEAGRNWERPPPPRISPSTDSIGKRNF